MGHLLQSQLRALGGVKAATRGGGTLEAATSAPAVAQDEVAEPKAVPELETPMGRGCRRGGSGKAQDPPPAQGAAAKEAALPPKAPKCAGPALTWRSRSHRREAAAAVGRL